jgi:hypothetical protein
MNMQNPLAILRNPHEKISNAAIQKWSRVGIIALVLVLSVLIALIADNRLSLLGIAFFPALLVILLFIKQPAYGFLAIVFCAFLVPSPFGSGRNETLNTPILLVALLTALWLFVSIVNRREIRIVKSRVYLPLFVFFVITAISFVNGQILYYSFGRLAPLSAQIGGLLVFFLSGLAFLLIGNQVKETIWLQRLVWLFLGISAIYLIGRLSHWTQNNIRPFFQYGSDASVFWIWLVAITASQLFVNKHIGRRWRVLLAITLFISFYVSYWLSSWWKSGWVPALVSLLVVLWFASPRLRWVGVLLGFLFVVINIAGSESLILGSEDYSVLTRGEAWKIVIEIGKVNPILGLGPANYYWYTPLFPILGYNSQFSSHNNYIDLYAQLGIVGLICFSWFATEIGMLGWRLKDRVPDGFPKAYVVGALAGLVGMLVTGLLGDWILPFIYNVGLHGFRSSVFGWLFLGGLVALEQIYAKPHAGAN